MYYKSDWYKTKERMSAFWQGEIIDRCMVSIFVKKKRLQGGLTNDSTTSECLKYWFDAEEILKRNIEYFENTLFLGDAFPQIHNGMGAIAHSCFFKNTEFKYLDTVWFFPKNIGEIPEEIEFDENSFIYKQTVEITKYLASESKGRFFVSHPDFCGNLDALANIRGSENLLIDMLENQEWVHRSLGKIQRGWEKIFSELYPILSAVNEGGTTIGWMNAWAEGKAMQLQSDISVMMSKGMYDEFVKPEIIQQSQWLDKSLYHVDGQEQLRHFDTLLACEQLSGLQWTSVDGQPPASDFIPQLRRAQQAGKSLLLFPTSLKDYENLLTGLSSKGLQLIMRTDSEDEGRHLLKLAEKLSHE